jgi:hypothetical protein
MNVREKNIAGGIAGAVALAAGSQAYAITPVAAPPNLASTLGTTTTAVWDADGNAVNDFALQFRFPNSTGSFGVVWQANFSPNTSLGNAVQGYLGPFINYGTALALGQQVGPAPATGTFRTAAQVCLGSIYRSGGIPSPYGGFIAGTPNGTNGGTQPSGTPAYMGFRLGTGGTARYGWVHVTGVSSTGMTFDAAALGAIGETVFAGIVPEPTTLAALAVGAAAFLRRPRKVA